MSEQTHLTNLFDDRRLVQRQALERIHRDEHRSNVRVDRVLVVARLQVLHDGVDRHFRQQHHVVEAGDRRGRGARRARAAAADAARGARSNAAEFLRVRRAVAVRKDGLLAVGHAALATRHVCAVKISFERRAPPRLMMNERSSRGDAPDKNPTGRRRRRRRPSVQTRKQSPRHKRAARAQTE
jgi:hypothetical protein